MRDRGEGRKKRNGEDCCRNIGEEKRKGKKGEGAACEAK